MVTGNAKVHSIFYFHKTLGAAQCGYVCNIVYSEGLAVIVIGLARGQTCVRRKNSIT